MNAKFPCVPKSFDHFWLGRQVLIPAVFYVTFIYKWLEVAPIADAVRWVDVSHLNLTRHSLLFQQGIHNEQAVTSDEAVRPVVLVFVEIDRFSERWVFFE